MSIPEIDIHGAKAHLDAKDATFVDVRDPMSYRTAHIPGARLITDANVGEFVRSTDKDGTVIVYCYHGNSSLGGAAYFLEQGFKYVYSMSGGFEAWRGVHPNESGDGPAT